MDIEILYNINIEEFDNVTDLKNDNEWIEFDGILINKIFPLISSFLGTKKHFRVKGEIVAYKE